jgi:iron(II)-dependent oxidoreductase
MLTHSVDASLLERELERARERTERLLAPLSEEQLVMQVSALMSPLVWDYAHIGHFEELWLLRNLAGREPMRAEHDDVYDAFAHVRSERGELPFLPPPAARAYVAAVREQALAVVAERDWDSDDPLLAGGFVVGMVMQHELQHQETMTQTLQLGSLPGPVPGKPPEISLEGEVLIEEGPFELGADGSEPWAYDNEHPAHELSLPAYFIDRAPVSNRDYLTFVAEGGYHDRALWTEEGWAWREEQAEAPLYWQRSGDGWQRRRFDLVEPVPPQEPVQHVSWYEADAYARWAGKRLPSEPEWEKAARTKPNELELLHGAVWQWTSSHFSAYPGFEAFPYREYSEVFFGSDYRVLRGGAWITDPVVARTSFRNWDYPERRQIFSGFRCARDA